MKKILSILIIVTMFAVMTTGCATKENPGSKETVKTQSETSVDGVNEIKYPFTYVDEAGRKVEIKEKPTKIAVTYLPNWETLIELGVMPIGMTSARNYEKTWDPFKGLDLSSVNDLGNSDMNIEFLTELKPDLILFQSNDLSKVNVENLEKIAPVVVLGPKVKMDWRHSLKEIGKVVGETQKAEEVITRINKNLSEEKEKLKKNYDNKTVMLMSMMGKDKYYITYRPDLYDKNTGLGLNTPEGFTKSETYEQVSMEAIVKMNPDYLFVNVFDGDEAIYKELSENPVWKSLKAVKEGHVYTLDGSGHSPSVMSTDHTVKFIVSTLSEKK